MQRQSEKRSNPRLALSYPIEMQVNQEGEAGRTRGVTSNLSARGAYFKTFAWQSFREGQRVMVKVRVPHPLQAGEELINLDMRADGEVLRLERILGREGFGEDGVDLKGVAIRFDEPLEFSYFWT